jgi:hypothetical protein
MKGSGHIFAPRSGAPARPSAATLRRPLRGSMWRGAFD